jgi:hypothetical protein
MNNDRITIKQSVNINASIEKVFDYIADGTKDPTWRDEVNEMILYGEVAVGTLQIEKSKLGKHDNYETPTDITVLERPYKIVLETPEDYRLWLRSTRIYESVDDRTTRFNYELSFDKAMVNETTPIPIPSIIVKWLYTLTIKKYLGKLKGILEG